MRRLRLHKPAVEMQLFPFLAVLICTMGALIVVLVLVVKHARGNAETIAEQRVKDRQEQPPAESADSAEVQQASEDCEWRQEILGRQRQELTGQLAQRRLELSHLEDHIRRLEQRIGQLRGQADDLQQAAAGRLDDRAATERELTRLQTALAQERQRLEDTRAEVAKRRRSYAIIPYHGPQGTERRPIYLECTATGIRIQPGDLVLTPDDLQGPLGPGNPLDAALRAIREHWARAEGSARGAEPYPLLIVRPDGAVAYGYARAAMSSWEDEFGYELVDADMELAFPPSDPTLKQLAGQSVATARERQAVLMAAMPRRFDRGGGSGSGGGAGAGSGGPPGSSPGEGGAPAGFVAAGGLGGPGLGGPGLGGPGLGGPGLGGPGLGGPGTGGPGTGGLGTGGLGTGGLGTGGLGTGGLGTGGTATGVAGAPNSNASRGQVGSVDGTGSDLGGGSPSGGAMARSIPGAAASSAGGYAASASGGSGWPGSGSMGGGGPAPGSASAGGGNAVPAGAASAVSAGRSAPATSPGVAGSETNASGGSEQTRGSAGPAGGSLAFGGGAAGGGTSGGGGRGGYRPDASSRQSADADEEEPSGAKPGGRPEFTYPGKTFSKGSPAGLPKDHFELEKPSRLDDGTGITRPIFVECYPDRLVIQADPGTDGAPQTIPVPGALRGSMEPLTACLRTHMERWGIAVAGGYWKPVLRARVYPGAEARFEELRTLLQRSGIEVERREEPRRVSHPGVSLPS